MLHCVYTHTHTHTHTHTYTHIGTLCVPHLSYQWYFRLLSYLNYYKWCCKEYWGVFIIFGCIPKGSIAGLYGSSISIFSVTSLLFSMQAIQMCSFTNNTQEFLSLHILASCLSDNTHCKVCNVMSHCGFDDIEHIFMCLLMIFISSLGKKDPLSIFKLDFFILRCVSSLYIFDTNPRSEVSFCSVQFNCSVVSDSL